MKYRLISFLKKKNFCLCDKETEIYESSPERSVSIECRTVPVSAHSSKDINDIKDTNAKRRDPPSTEFSLLSEAICVLAVADEQFRYKFNAAALRNYRIAVMILRVLKCFIRPKYAESAASKFAYALEKFKLCDSLLGVFVREHYSDPCTMFYEINNEHVLGKGNYGNVCMCKHRKSGQKYACKVGDCV